MVGRRRMKFTYPSGATPLDGYTIKRGIGIGGFGEVYFALNDAGKEVALKKIQRNLDIELRGVRQCLNMKHVNLISLWDIRTTGEGESWVVMEYVPGRYAMFWSQTKPGSLMLMSNPGLCRWLREWPIFTRTELFTAI
jgi:serine/threonine protein kinase